MLPRGATRPGLPPYLFAGRIVVVDGLEPENGVRTIGHHVDGSVRSAVDIPDSAGVFENDFLMYDSIGLDIQQAHLFIFQAPTSNLPFQRVN